MSRASRHSIRNHELAMHFALRRRLKTQPHRFRDALADRLIVTAVQHFEARQDFIDDLFASGRGLREQRELDAVANPECDGETGSAWD